jgi:hypothetical protein
MTESLIATFAVTAVPFLTLIAIFVRRALVESSSKVDAVLTLLFAIV